MDTGAHWDSLWKKAPDAGSWYRPHLEVSLALIERAAPDRLASIIEVGAGESTLVDDLLARGYRDITLLDVSETALAETKKRLGAAAARDSASWKARRKSTIAIGRCSAVSLLLLQD